MGQGRKQLAYWHDKSQILAAECLCGLNLICCGISFVHILLAVATDEIVERGSCSGHISTITIEKVRMVDMITTNFRLVGVANKYLG
jgi:hypothetical protein